MTIYEVRDWDWMASNMGDEYVAGRYLVKREADEHAKQLNENARKAWMARCSPEGRENYRDMAHVVPVEVV